MTLTDLMNALSFLQRVVARGDQEEVLFRTIASIENEIKRRRANNER